MDTKIKNKLASLELDCGNISGKKIQETMNFLSNTVEHYANEIQQLEKHIQNLKDENNRLKGEQGKPIIRPQKKDDGDVSSEKERRPKKKKKPKQRKKKKDSIKATRTEDCSVNKSTLPDDAEFKGYDSVIIQDLQITQDNIEFKREIYYSASLEKRIIAPLPKGYNGEYGPQVKSFILCLYHDAKVSQPALLQLLTSMGMVISKATISRIITDSLSVFHEEKRAILAAGLESTDYQHIDDTGARVNGKNSVAHILCNPYYTAYFTRQSKDRLTLLRILSDDDLDFHINEESFLLICHLGLPKKYHAAIEALCSQPVQWKEAEIDEFLKGLFPDPKKHRKNRTNIKEACAIVAYQDRPDAIKILVCDDAPQFKSITECLSLCWIHDGRHYKKITPTLQANRIRRDNFITQYWDFYHDLLAYKALPVESLAKAISEQFDQLFSMQTGYDVLDDRIKKTFAKKNELLLVLKYPHLPLHNNPAELGARSQAKKRDVSLQTKNEKGTQAKDTMMTIVETAKKLSVNVLHYIHDRVSENFSMPSLASIINEKSQSNQGTG